MRQRGPFEPPAGALDEPDVARAEAAALGDAGGPFLESPPTSLKEATARGFLWTAGQALLIRAFGLVGFIVLARLLSPRDFGIAALANVFALLLQLLAVGGFSPTLVQRQDVDKTDLDTVFWMTVAVGLVLGIVMFASAPLVADAFDEPALKGVLRVLSATFVLVGVSSTHGAVVQRRLDFRGIALPTVISSIGALAVAVVLAFAGFGYWALVAQTVVATALTAIGLVVVSGYRPGGSFSLRRLRDIFGDSVNYLGTAFTIFLNQRSDDFLIGGFLGSVQLGIYSVAYRLVSVLVEVLTLSVRTVAFPVLSRVQGDRARLVNAYRAATRMSAILITPIFVFAAVAANEIIEVGFGTKWLDGVPVMQVLCAFAVVQGLDQLTLTVLQSVGRARIVFRIAMAGTVLQIAAVIAVVELGLVWVAAALALRAYLVTPIAVWVASRELGGGVRPYIQQLLWPAACSALMVAAVVGIEAALPTSTPGVLLLGAMTVVAGITYAGALRTLAHREFNETVDYLRTVLRRRGGSSAGAPATAGPRSS